MNVSRYPSTPMAMLVVVLLLIVGNLGCTWRSTSRGNDLDLSTAQISNPVFDGIYETFGAEGAMPLFDQHAGVVPATYSPNNLVLSDELTLTDFVDGVVERHPTLEAAIAAIEAAEEKYPQAVALHDPQFRFLTGPTIFGSNDGMQLWRLQAQQPIDGFGKRGWRGEIAREQAAGASQDMNIARRKLRQTAIRSYFELAAIEAVAPLMHADHEAAQKEYAAKQLTLVSSPSTSIGEVEQLELDRIELDKTLEEFHWHRLAAQQQANVLLGRNSQEQLPPPSPPGIPQVPWDEPSLHATLSRQRPEMLRANARCREAEATVELARCMYHPDFYLVGRFDTTADQFWLPDRAFIRPQLGFNVHMPLRKNRLEAQVREAQANLRKSRKEREAVEQDIRREVSDTVSDLQRMNHNLQRLNRLSELARKKKEQFEQYSTQQDIDSAEHIKAHRQWLKYEMQRIRADYSLRHRLHELHYDLHMRGASPPAEPVIEEGQPPVFSPPQLDDWAFDSEFDTSRF